MYKQVEMKKPVRDVYSSLQALFHAHPCTLLYCCASGRVEFTEPARCFFFFNRFCSA